MRKPTPFQFGLVQLLWGTALAAVYCFFFVVALNRDPPRLTDPVWEVLFLATPPVAGGFIGLFRNNTKGMLVGIAAGFAVTFVFAFFFLPGVQ
jgi:hypothetical protein